MDDGAPALRRELIRLAWPIAVSTLSYAIMSLVDTLFVGRLGTAELAGVALGSTAFFSVICFGMGLMKGSKVLVSQAVGRGDPEDAERHAAAALALGLGLALVTMLAGIAVAEVLPAIASGAAGEHARAYARVRALGALPLMVYYALREVRYGFGDSRGPMNAVLVGNGLNIGLDALFLFGFGWGVAGAAWATLLASAGQAIWLWPSRSRRPIERAAIRANWRIGVPTAVQFSLEVGSFALLAALLAGLGDDAIGAHQIALQVCHFGFLPLVALSEAASVMAGQAVGAERREQLHPVARESARIGYGYAVVFGAMLFGAARPITGAFTDDPSLQAVAMSLLYVGIVFQLVDVANLMARGILRGAGDVTFPALVAIVSAWVCTPPLTWLFGYVWGLGALGGWLALFVECAVGTVILWRRMVRGPRSELGLARA